MLDNVNSLGTVDDTAAYLAGGSGNETWARDFAPTLHERAEEAITEAENEMLPWSTLLGGLGTVYEEFVA